MTKQLFTERETETHRKGSKNQGQTFTALGTLRHLRLSRKPLLRYNQGTNIHLQRSLWDFFTQKSGPMMRFQK